MDANQKERYIRWQGYRIGQLSFATNLFLGFAVASLAYVVNMQLENKPHSNIPIENVIFWWSACAVLGCVATISKLLDYRHTARKIKYADKAIFNKRIAKFCGYITWGCFWAQIVTYAIGAYLFLTGVTTIAELVK